MTSTLGHERSTGQAELSDLTTERSDLTTERSQLTTERNELIAELVEAQSRFERRALSSMTEPLISTPLTMQQLKVLMLIATHPERATGHQLAELLKVSVATMSGLVDRLVEHQMVRRDEDPADRRVRRLSVTAEGQATIRDLLTSSATMPVPALERLALDDLRALVRGILALDQVVREVDRAEPIPTVEADR